MPKPFGFGAGETPSSAEASYFVSLHSVPKPHPDFQSYMADWSPENGLTGITAMSVPLSDAGGCLVARGLYSRVRSQLTQVYGAFEDLDWENPDSASHVVTDCWQAMSRGDQSFLSRWSAEAGSALDADIQTIELLLTPTANFGEAIVSLTYQFPGYGSGGPALDLGQESL